MIVLLGKQSAKEKREAYERLTTLPKDAQFVIIATGKLAGEGFDYPRLDTLFLAVPISWKGRIAQYAGRLHRVYEGKNDVHIYDYVDTNIPLLDNMYHTRIKGYKAIGYKVLVNSDTDTNATTQSFIYDKDDYWEEFQKDSEGAGSELVIASPRMQMHQVARALDTLASPLLRSVKITVVTLPLEEHPVTDRPAAEACLDLLNKQGIKVITKPGLHQKMAIIDQGIIWYGSLNFLGNARKTDNLMRFQEPGIAQKLLVELNQL
jgi:superfamily II DNA or RNA helicase